jgi:hypothetical protein
MDEPAGRSACKAFCSAFEDHKGVPMRGLMEEYLRGSQPAELAEEYDISPSSVARHLHAANGRSFRGSADRSQKMIPTFALDKGERFRG